VALDDRDRRMLVRLFEKGVGSLELTSEIGVCRTGPYREREVYVGPHD
jgi:hypothetical protein